MEAAWVPTTKHRNEKAEMGMDGEYHWKHVLWLRAHKARFDKLAKNNGWRLGKRDLGFRGRVNCYKKDCQTITNPVLIMMSGPKGRGDCQRETSCRLCCTQPPHF
jgi:hypothetical protein